MRYFTETPLQEGVNHAFDDWQVQGKMSALFNLELALGQENIDPQIQLEAELKDNQLILPELNLGLSKLTGKIVYNSTSGLKSDLIEGQVLGGRSEERRVGKEW